MSNLLLTQILRTRGFGKIKVFTLTVIKGEAFITVNNIRKFGYSYAELTLNTKGILGVSNVFFSTVA